MPRGRPRKQKEEIVEENLKQVTELTNNLAEMLYYSTGTHGNFNSLSNIDKNNWFSLAEDSLSSLDKMNYIVRPRTKEDEETHDDRNTRIDNIQSELEKFIKGIKILKQDVFPYRELTLKIEQWTK